MTLLLFSSLERLEMSAWMPVCDLSTFEQAGENSDVTMGWWFREVRVGGGTCARAHWDLLRH